MCDDCVCIASSHGNSVVNLCGAGGLPFPKGAITVGSARGGNKWRLICMKQRMAKPEVHECVGQLG